jgi:hypothetical protein
MKWPDPRPEVRVLIDGAPVPPASCRVEPGAVLAFTAR